MKFALVLMLVPTMIFASGLSDQLHAELKEGQTNFSDLEMILIASGVDTPESLETYKGKFQEMMDKVVLSPKQQKQKGNKKARNLHKLLFTKLKKEDQNAKGLVDLLDNGAYNMLSATYFFSALAQRDGVSGKDFKAIKDGVNIGMLENTDGKGYAAAFFIPQAFAMSDDQAATLLQYMEISTMLAPSSTYGIGTYDVQLYNRALNLFNENKFEPAAYMSIGASKRYPTRKEFQSLCFNIGLKLFQNSVKEGNLDKVTALGDMLSPLTGEYRDDFNKVLSTVYYNKAVALYNDGKFEDALTILEKSDPEQPGYETVKIGSLEKLVEASLANNDDNATEAILKRLDEVSEDRGKRMRLRLGQLKLQALDKAGKHEEAVALALTDLETDIGKNNYIAVVTKFVQKMREKSVPDALKYLEEKIPDNMKDNETIQGLRFNSYVAWLEQYKDEQYEKLLPIYKKALGDPKLKLTDKDKAILMEGYGNAHYKKVEYLVAERHWKKADAASKAALKACPNHANLLKQRQLVETILRRVSEN